MSAGCFDPYSSVATIKAVDCLVLATEDLAFILYLLSPCCDLKDIQIVKNCTNVLL